MKELARYALKIVAGIAALVFIRANPFGGNEGIAFLVSIPVLLVCGGLLIWLKDHEDENGDKEEQQPRALNRGRQR